MKVPHMGLVHDRPLPEGGHSKAENSHGVKDAPRVNNSGPPAAVPSGRVQLSRWFGSFGDHDRRCYGYDRSTPRIFSRSYEGNDKCILKSNRKRRVFLVAGPLSELARVPTLKANMISVPS